MADDTSAPTRKKVSGSKKSKKGWRKRTDIQDIEDHIEEKRLEERSGGLVAEKSNESLFFVDTKVDANEPIKKSKKVTVEVSEDEEETEYVSAKDKERKRLRLEAQREVEQAKALQNVNVKNIWGQEVMSVAEDNSYLEPAMKKKKKMPKSMKINTLTQVESIKVAEPGASYNPDFESHQSLLLKAHKEEFDKLKKQRQLNKKVKMVSVEKLKKQSKVWLKEMSEGLFDKKESDDPPELVDVEEDAPTVHPVSADDRKTLKEKRKEREAKEEERQKALSKHEKRKVNDVFRLKTLNKEIKATEEKRKLKQKDKLLKLEDKKKKPKRLGKHKFKEGNVTVKLSSELTGNLRGLRMEGSLLHDRFRSFQRRGIIETRRPVMRHRKYKIKQYEKRAHKVKNIKEFNEKTK